MVSEVWDMLLYQLLTHNYMNQVSGWTSFKYATQLVLQYTVTACVAITY